MIQTDPRAVIERSRLLVIVRLPSVGDEVADALQAGGVQAAEISLLSGDATAAIARWRERFPDLVVGAGTVTTAQEADRAIDAGAAFLISPALHLEVAEKAGEAGIPYIPGAFTPAEVFACAAAGATLIKLFPAGRLGAGYVRDLLGPLPKLRLLPTGGIGADNALAFLGAGAAAVAVGSSLVGPDSTAETIAASAKRLTDLIRTSPEGGA
jgi:2-dehydro-3-deoxyphosphogluconate aldolase/(4S)-4-hydroxy-2-oxoglutarate aldolase